MNGRTVSWTAQAGTAFVFLFVMHGLASSLAPTVSFEDTGEAIGSAAELGTTHPPGSTWATLVGHLAWSIPLGDPAFRTSILSALCVAGISALVYLLAAEIGGARMGWAAAVAVAGSRTAFWQASIADKYPLAALLLGLGLCALHRTWAARDAHLFAGVWLLVGLAVSNHPMGLYLVPAAIIASVRLGLTRRRIAVLMLCLLLPILARAEVVPLLAVRNPWMNWGNPDTFQRLVDYLTAKQYRAYMVAGQAVEPLGERMVHQLLVAPWTELGPVLGLSAVGFGALVMEDLSLAVGAAVLLGSNAVFALAFSRPHNEPYYIFSTMILAILAGVGVARLTKRSRWLALTGLLAFWPLATSWNHSPRDGHYLPWDLAWNEAAPLPKGAIICCSEDDQANTLTYLHEVCGFRPDIRVLPVQFLCGVATHDGFAKHSPDVVFPPLGYVGPRGMHDYAGNYIPRLAAANPQRRCFVTADLLPTMPQDLIAPFGTGYEVFTDPKLAARANEVVRPLPHLRLRGFVDAGKWDLRSFRAGVDLGAAYTIQGLRLMAQRRYREAEVVLRMACRLPLAPAALAAARSNLVQAHTLAAGASR